MTIDAADGVAAAVHDTVVVSIGCNCIPVFVMVDGGRGRSLFTFKCVYNGCSAFLDVRVLPHVDIVKWVLMDVSHRHDFSVFPQRLPRNTFRAETKAAIRNMVLQNHSSAEIRLKNNVLCNKDVFYNAVRMAREEKKEEQSRALRDAAAKSDIWSSEIHLMENNVFHEAFFVNAVLLARRLNVTNVYMDDTSCTNTFGLPVVSVLCRDDYDTVHCVAWELLRNRTTDAFVRFLTFVSKFYRDVKTVVCDRHVAQRNTIVRVFGESVKVLHCCVHVARNIQRHTGMKSDLLSRFWAMRYARTEESERLFIDTLERLHAAKHSMFTTYLMTSLDTFVPSRIGDALDVSLFPSLTHCVTSTHLVSFSTLS